MPGPERKDLKRFILERKNVVFRCLGIGWGRSTPLFGAVPMRAGITDRKLNGADHLI